MWMPCRLQSPSLHIAYIHTELIYSLTFISPDGPYHAQGFMEVRSATYTSEAQLQLAVH